MLFKRILLRMKKPYIIVLISITLFTLFSLVFLKGAIFSLLNKSADIIDEKTGLKIGLPLYHLESTLNIFRPKKDLWKGDLSIIQLKLSKRDIKHFDNLTKIATERGYMPEEENTWRKVKLKYNEETYDAEIKIHGESRLHWMSGLKGYNIKILNGSSINGVEKFSLLNIEERGFEGKIVKFLSEEFDLWDIRDDFIALKMNGVEQGFYYFLEKLDGDFLERNRCSSCVVIRIDDNKFQDHPFFSDDDLGNNPYGLFYEDPTLHDTPFDYEIGHVEIEKTDLDPNKVVNAVNDLFSLIKKDEDIIDYFDMDNAVNFEAARMIIGGGHIGGDNLRLAYSATNSKFYFILWEGGIYKLEIKEGGFEQSLNTFAAGSEEDISEERKIHSLLNRNDAFRQLKYKKAYEYASNERYITKIEEFFEEYQPYANSHKGSIIGTKVLEEKIDAERDSLRYNIYLIKDALEYATVYINAVEKNNKINLEITPDSISQLKIENLNVNLLEEYSGSVTLNYNGKNKVIYINERTDSLDLSELFEDIYFMTGLAEDLGTEKRTYFIELTFGNDILIESISFKVINNVTGKLLEGTNVNYNLANANDNIEALPIEEFLVEYNNFNWNYENNELILLKGDYILNKDMIIPEVSKLNIEEGVEISIDEGKSIISYSPIEVKGTKENPLIIKALDKNKPFGVFGIVGLNWDKQSNINWLKLSDGNEKFINGIYFSGGLSIYHMDVNMRNTIISNNHADDGLSIKYGKVLIENSEFKDNFADQIDLDFVDGTVKNSKFYEASSGADENGDGLDLSGSTILIEGNTFENFKDKGISIGEKTKAVLSKNIIKNNNLGVAVKDSSDAFFSENIFENNKVAISAYMKKVLYARGGYIYLFDNKFEGNAKLFELDETSKKEDAEENFKLI